MQISGIVRSDITVNQGETLTMTGDVQLARDATITVEAGGVFDLSGFSIQNFGRILLQGNNTTFAVIRNGTYNTDSTTGVLESYFGEMRSLWVDSFFSDGSLVINNSLVFESSIEALSETSIINSALINSDFDVGIETVSVSRSTFFDTQVTIDSWAHIDLYGGGVSIFTHVNFIHDDTAIYLDSWASADYNLEIIDGFINADNIDDKIYDAEDDLNVSYDITTTSFNNTPYTNEPEGFAVGTFLIKTSDLYSGSLTSESTGGRTLQFVNLGPDGGLYSADILIDGTELVTAEEAQLYRSYYGAMGRLPDKLGYDWWMSEIESGRHNLASMSEGFIHSVEFMSMADNDRNGVVESSELVMHLYQGVFGREPDQAGFDWWLNQLDTGVQQQQDLFVGMTQSDEYVQITAPVVADMLFL